MKKVLVISANTRNLVSIAAMLKSRGYSVIAKKEAGSALSEIRTGAEVDVVIADYSLPDMDAQSFMAALKRSASAPPPVIFQNERIDVQDYLSALSLGAFEFLFMPVHPVELLRIVEVASRKGVDNKRITALEEEGQYGVSMGPYL